MCRTLFTVILLLVSSALFPSLGAAAPNPPPVALLDTIGQQTGNQASVAYHAGTGLVSFLGTDPTHPIPQPAALPPDATSEVAARQFLTKYGPLFGVQDQAQELQVMEVQEADGGRSFVRFQQVSGTVPVLGGELIVQLNDKKDVLSVNGEVLPKPAVNTIPTVSADDAVQRAVGSVAKDYEVPAEALQSSAPELWIYSSLLMGAPGPAIARLAWRMEVQAADLLPIRELVLVDAQRGFVLLHFNENDSARYRKIYDNQNNPALGLPGNGPVRIEGGPASGVSDVNYAYDYAGDVYDFYWNNFGRDSLDGAGMQLISTVRYCPAATSCPYQNAFWNGQQMVYGEGFASADDVVGHEMTHGVTNHESRLFYYMQSGAINESFSDIFGEFIDLGNGKGNDSPSVRWLIGEDLSVGAIRSMKNPPLYGDPDRMGSTLYKCGSEDNGGVHTNSGVGNKVAYLMVDGDTFNGRTVSGIGITKVAKIYYEVQTHLLTSAGDYKDLYNSLQQACTNLVGTSGITAGDCQQVKNALDAVEMSQQPTSCPANEAPVCPAGQIPFDLFFDNLENPASGRWTKGTLSGVEGWFYPQNPNRYSGFDATYATSGEYNFFGDDPETSSDAYIAMTSGVSLAVGTSPYFRFNHAYSFETGASGTMYDGGVIEYSTNGGSTWSDAGAMITENGYRGTLAGSNPLGARQAFGIRSNGYISTRLNLSTLTGRTVRFRFRLGADASNGDWGWYIDDIRLYTCSSLNYTHRTYLPMGLHRWQPSPDAPVLNAIDNADGNGNYVVTWQAANRASNYTLQEDDNAAFSSPATVYDHGTGMSWSASGKAAGTYYYRVKATNAYGDSGWSNTQPVIVGSVVSPIVNGNFESGTTGWTQYSMHGWPVIANSGWPGSVTPHGGSWAAWLGGEYDDISYIQQQVLIPPGSSYLAYWHWIASADACGYDFGGVIVNNTIADVYTLCSSSATGGWVKHVVNLGAYAGQSVQLQIRVETDSSLNSNLFVDDVALQAGPSAAEAGTAPSALGPNAPPSEEALRQLKANRMDGSLWSSGQSAPEPRLFGVGLGKGK
jgi:bacillolysin